MVRETRLRELGYDSYNAYLHSPAWRDVRERYRASDLPQLCMCGATNWQLHHTTYIRVGREHLADLIPLCAECHATAHVLEAAGIIDLGLEGFYYDAERAAEGRRYLAALAASCPDSEDLRREKHAAFWAHLTERNTARGQANRILKRLKKQARDRAPQQPISREASLDDLKIRTFDP